MLNDYPVPLARAWAEDHHEGCVRPGDSTERLRRGADESAAHQAELRARAERVIHRGDFIEQVRRGADETAVRNAELRAGARVTRARPATGGQ